MKIFTLAMALPLMILGFLTIFTVSYSQPVLAQEQLCIGAGGTFDEATGKCSRDDTDPIFNTDPDEQSIFQTIANILLFLTGAISVIMLIIGGIRYVLSSGDAQATAGAKDTILYAIIGLVVSFLAFAIARFVINGLTN